VTMRTLAGEAARISLLAILTLGSSSAAVAQSVAAPKNLRVTGVTDWTVALTWDASKAKAPASYVVQCSNGRSMTVAGSQTAATFSNGFDYNRTYSFRVFAVSASGAWSSASNTVTATLLNDTTPAATPVVSFTGSARRTSTWHGLTATAIQAHVSTFTSTGSCGTDRSQERRREWCSSAPAHHTRSE
jgi:hypothetical protein